MLFSRKNILKVVIFIFGFLLFIFIYQTIIFSVIKQINVGEYGVLNKIDQGAINAEIIISGTSRAKKAVNPVILSESLNMSCFNLSTVGADLGVQIPKLKWYLNKNKKPKIIVQDVPELNGRISNSIFEPYKYLPYLGDDSLYFGLSKIDPDFWMHKYFYPTNLSYFNIDFMYLIYKDLRNNISNKDHLLNGHFPDKSKWASSLEILKNKFPEGKTANLSDTYKLYLKSLITFCKSNDIFLILLTIPNYSEILSITKNYDEIIYYYNKLSKENNVGYINLSKCSIADDSTNYYNYSHLNASGAVSFSTLLAAKIDSIMTLDREGKFSSNK